MGLREQLAEHRESFDAILAVASCRESLGFADLMWGPFDIETELRRMVDGRDPGVLFESINRVFVVEQHLSELRFYAGGWNMQQYNHQCELGVFQTVSDAVRYAEALLVHGQHPRLIPVPRSLLSAVYYWEQS
jgi:hypothetical protein